MKKVTSILLIIATMLAFSVPAFAAKIENFTDVQKGAWFYDYVEFGVRRGVVNGTSGTTFSPDDPILRAQFVTIIARHFANGKTHTVESTHQYTDVKDTDYYAGAAYWAAQHEFAFGATATEFKPYEPITREDAAAMLYTYANKYLEVVGVRPSINNPKTFKDEAAISSYALEAVKYLQSIKVINGDDMGKFNPKDGMTRAEAMAMYTRYCEALWGDLSNVPNVSVGGFVVSNPTDPVDPEPTDNVVIGTHWQTKEFVLRMNAEFEKLVNEARAAEGLGPLKYDERYQFASDIRAYEYAEKIKIYGPNITNDQAHTRLDGSHNGTLFDDCPELKERAGGENLCLRNLPDFDTPEHAANTAFEAWMNSPGHKALLMDEYDVGFALGVHYERTRASFAYTSVW